MSTWVSNGPCPSCGSKDNLATYDDGHKWCWGCGHWIPGDALSAVRRLAQPAEDVKTNSVVLPHDVDTNYSTDALKWIAKYDLSRSDLLANRVLWSDDRQLLIFSLTDGEGRLVAWQGRNFGEKYRTKWFGRGNLEDTFIFFPRNTKRITRIIFVEDIISAIRIGKAVASAGLSDVAMPVFGSHVARKRLSRCSLFANSVTFWLDRDKASESIKFQRTAHSLGFTSSVIITEKDPKEYTQEEILGQLFTLKEMQ